MKRELKALLDDRKHGFKFWDDLIDLPPIRQRKLDSKRLGKLEEMLKNEQELLKEYVNQRGFFYWATVYNRYGKQYLKYGSCININERVADHKKEFPNFILLEVRQTIGFVMMESNFKFDNKLRNTNLEKRFKGRKHKCIELTSLSLEEVREICERHYDLIFQQMREEVRREEERRRIKYGYSAADYLSGNVNLHFIKVN